MRLQLEDISDQEFQTMHAAVLRLLEEIGVLFEDDEARALLTRAGNRADEAGRVHLAPSFVESMLALIPKDGFKVYGRDMSRVAHVAVDSMCFRPSTGTPFVLDYESRRRRKATMDDARVMALLVDAIDEYEMVNSVVNPEDAPGTRGNLRRFVNAHRWSLKPSDITVMTPEEVALIGEVAAAIRGGEAALREMPLTIVDAAMITPLRCAGEQVQAMLECARRGIPVEVLTSPSLGVSSPITLAGGAALAIAECVAALCLMYQVAPGLGVVNTARISPTNMRTTAYNYGTPELGMGSVLVAAHCARYNLPCNLYGFGTVAKASGAQCMMEKMLSGIPLALGRPHMITGSAQVDNAMITSPEQLVIDAEAIRFIRRLKREIVVDDEAIGIDALKTAMQSDGCLLAEEHTMTHLRAGEVLDAKLGQWTSYSQWEEAGAPDLFDRAHGKVEELLDSHKVAPFDSEVEKRIDARAAGTIGRGSPFGQPWRANEDSTDPEFL